MPQHSGFNALEYSSVTKTQKKARSLPQPQWIGVDSNKRPIKTTFGVDHSSSQQSGSSRYPNYLPQLRAQRVESSKQTEIQAKLHKRLNLQRQAEEMALNRMVLQKAQRINRTVPTPIPPPMPLRDREPRLIGLPKRNDPKEVVSLFRTDPASFSDSASPVLQVELNQTHQTPSLPAVIPLQELQRKQQQWRAQTSIISSRTTDSIVDEYLKKKTRNRYRR